MLPLSLDLVILLLTKNKTLGNNWVTLYNKVSFIKQLYYGAVECLNLIGWRMFWGE